MHTVPMKLVTIVGEAVLSERLPASLRSHGATGWTMAEVSGDGSRGMRTSPMPGENIRLETVVSAAAAEEILETLATEYFPHYALVAWVTDVQVVRGEKYR